MTGVAYGQDMETGQIEATGQIGFVSGIGTHGAFGGSVGVALNQHVLAYGEFLYIPLGSSTVRILGVDRNVSAKALTSTAAFNISSGNTARWFHTAMSGWGSCIPPPMLRIPFLSRLQLQYRRQFERFLRQPRWRRPVLRDGTMGLRSEFTIFAGSNSFVRIGAGVFYEFGK